MTLDSILMTSDKRTSSLYEEKQSCIGTNVVMIERVRLMNWGKDKIELLITQVLKGRRL